MKTVSADHRDLVIEMATDDYEHLLEQVVDLTVERDGYREALQAAIHQPHDLHLQHQRLEQ